MIKKINDDKYEIRIHYNKKYDFVDLTPGEVPTDPLDVDDLIVDEIPVDEEHRDLMYAVQMGHANIKLISHDDEGITYSVEIDRDMVPVSKKTPCWVYSKIVRAADELSYDDFEAGWLHNRLCNIIPGWKESDEPERKYILSGLYGAINRTPYDIRMMLGMTQQMIADRLSVPLRTWQGWEGGRTCPVYIRVLFQKEMGITDLAKTIGTYSYPVRHKNEEFFE